MSEKGAIRSEILELKSSAGWEILRERLLAKKHATIHLLCAEIELHKIYKYQAQVSAISELLRMPDEIISQTKEAPSE